MRHRIATRFVAKRLHPLLPSRVTRRLLATPLGRRAMTKLFDRKVDAKTTPRGH